MDDAPGVAHSYAVHALVRYLTKARKLRLLTLGLAAVLALAACGDADLLPTATPNVVEPVSQEAVASPAPSPTSEPVAVEESAGAIRPEYCAEPELGVLNEVGTTPASPYLVSHPTQGDASTPTVVFVPGGRGSRRSADGVWTRYLAEGTDLEAFRLVIPYSEDIDLFDDARRVLAIVDEVLACYGGDEGAVHIAGVSNGGLIAFALMTTMPEMFTTLLGAPGAFPRNDPELWGDLLTGKRVFNGVGELDGDWQPDVLATHEALSAQGVDSVYVEFPGQGHVVDADFDESIFVDFWLAR